MEKVEVTRLGGGVEAAEINACSTMQLATTLDAQQWIATVYFVLYNNCFYWLSFPDRRHSQEVARNAQAAIAIVLQSSQPVVGIQAEGSVDAIHESGEARPVLDMYIKKYNQGKQFIDHLNMGTNEHVLYRFTPHRVMVFDERNKKSAGVPQEVMII